MVKGFSQILVGFEFDPETGIQRPEARNHIDRFMKLMKQYIETEGEHSRAFKVTVTLDETVVED